MRVIAQYRMEAGGVDLFLAKRDCKPLQNDQQHGDCKRDGDGEG